MEHTTRIIGRVLLFALVCVGLVALLLHAKAQQPADGTVTTITYEGTPVHHAATQLGVDTAVGIIAQTYGMQTNDKFALYCAACHLNGVLNAPHPSKMKLDIEVVKQGRGYMPAFSHLTDEEIEEIFKTIRNGEYLQS